MREVFTQDNSNRIADVARDRERLLDELDEVFTDHYVYRKSDESDVMDCVRRLVLTHRTVRDLAGLVHPGE